MKAPLVRPLPFAAAVVGAVCLLAAPTVAQQPVNEAAQQAAQMQGSPQSQDPPSRISRLSVLNGQASVEPASVDTFSPAEINLPLTTGDRLYTAAGATAAIDADTFSVRLGERTDLTLTGLTDRLAQLGLAAGAVHLRSWSVDPQGVLELDTPNLALTVLEAGDLRIAVDPQGNTTTVDVLSGSAQLDAPGLSQELHAGQSLRIGGGDAQSGDAVYAQWLRPTPPDGLDAFSASVDSQYQTAAAVEGQYIGPDTVGADDLTAYGNWEQDDDLGAVWFPAVVAADWQPYRNGRWCWIAPWGWTWIGAERWGFAPYHYGRWATVRGRWGWLPGPRRLRPIYAPALVAFVGTPGSGTAAWFPLGPREPFLPWYHASPLYENRVNAANLPTRNLAEAQRLYGVRDRFAFAAPGSYANRGAGTIAMPELAFAAGRRVDREGGRPAHGRELADAPVLPHPLINPTRTMVSNAPATALPTRPSRPQLASRPVPLGGRSQAAPVGPAELIRGGNAPLRTLPAGAGAADPNAQTQANSPVGGSANGAGGGSTPPLGGTITRVGPANPGTARPLPSGQPLQPPATLSRPPAARTQPGPAPTSGGISTGTAAPTPPAAGTRPPTGVTGGVIRPVGPPALRHDGEGETAIPHPLMNRETPPPARPSFEQQRQAMQNSDPGRPLDPQQMQNLRESRPAGQPSRPENVPHPVPQAAPRPAAPPPPPPARPAPAAASTPKHG